MPGEYYIGGVGEGAANTPYPAGSFSLKVEYNASWGNGVKQIWSSYYGNDTWTRVLDNHVWSPWLKLATATPPQEHALPLAEGKAGVDYNAFRKDQNGRVTLFVSIRRADGADFTGYEGAFTLPEGYRPYRNEIRRIDLVGADGGPAGYAHLHIYSDGNAGIAGFGTGVKTAFCECGFWSA